jgi:threonine dehydrogenase-like Zn-dependent dehydrogenase
MTTTHDTGSALAAVTLPGGRTEVRRFAMPGVDRDTGLLRVDASGVCGTDVGLARGKLTEPAVLGHHVVGQLVQVGDEAARRWGVREGDRVALEEYLPCGDCPACGTDRYRLCPQTDLWGGGRRVGLVPVHEEPALWGGNAQYMHLPANAVVHRLPDELDAELAAWTLPFANAVDWVQRVGRLAAGETVVVLGPGYHGLAAVAAAVQGGAGRVLVGGLAGDAPRLALAERLGAQTFDVSAGDPVEAVRELTGGALGDLVVDLVGAGPETFGVAAAMVGQLGRLVLAGAKTDPLSVLDTGALIRRVQTVHGVRGRAPESVRRSIELLAGGGCGLREVPSYDVPLSEVGDVLARLVAGEGPDTPHVVVRPWAEASTSAGVRA